MAKLTTTDISSILANPTGAATAINNNNTLIETALENTLSRDGTSPNQMEASLDMNDNRILNLPTPVNASEPATKDYVDDLVIEINTDGAFIIATNDTGDINHTADGTGAVERTVLAKFNELKTPEDFGAVGDGVADDSAAWQAFIDDASPGATLKAYGNYKINTMLEISTSNLTFDLGSAIFDGSDIPYTLAFATGCVFKVVGTQVMTTTLASSAALSATTVALTSVTGIVAGDIIRFISDRPLYDNQGTIAYYSELNRVTSISGSNVTLETPIPLALSTAANIVSVTVVRPVENIRFIGGIFEGGGVDAALANGYGRVAIAGYGVVNLSIEGATINAFQGFAIQTDYALDVSVSDCHITGIDDTETIVEGTNSGFYGPYFYRTRRGTVVHCKMVRTRHAADAAEAYGITQSHNIAVDNYRAAFGSHEEVHDLQIIGNIAHGCNVGALVRAYTCSILDNTFEGAGRAINTLVMADTYEGRGRLIISNNRLRTTTTGFAAGIDILGFFEPLIITNNEIVTTSYGVWLNADRIRNCLIANNNIKLSAASSSGVVYDSKSYFQNVVIRGNLIDGYQGSAVFLDGTDDPTSPANYIIVADNVGFAEPTLSGNGYRLVNDGYFGEDIVFKDNVHFGDSSAALSLCPAQEYRIASAPVAQGNIGWPKTGHLQEIIGTNTSGAHTGNSTLLAGQKILRGPVSVGSPHTWVVSVSGTEGTLSGVTGSITSGTATLTMTGNTSAKVRLGAYITIPGAGVASATLAARVTAIAADFNSCTISTNASTTVAGATLGFTNPTFTSLGNL